ncbi:LLM class flavin-dependent oxidoreductase [Puniceibacterium confluentis]|uniref:LLM class flavin-dependent oxidoreductase n=1 Tax=Puniceibacterium confluentis TaxID=1958944 RepID=UPI003563A92C
MARTDKLRLGTFVYTFGFHPAAWLHPGSDVKGANDIAHLAKVAQISEAACLDFMFFADSPAAAVGHPEALARQPTKMNRFEPITAITALSMVTQRLGFVATASTSYYEPYNIARLFGSADQISRGRICWNVVTSDHDETGYNYNRQGLDPHGDRYDRGEEFLDVVLGLWDSFEDDALLLDRENGLYHDKDKLHQLDHVGPHFQVRGPLNIARTPQGRPVIAQAGGSERGKELAARTAEVVFSLASNIDKNRAFYQDVKGRMARYGRKPSDLKIMPGIVINVGETRAEAEARAQEMVEVMHPEVGLLMLQEFLETDLHGADLDQPFPMERMPARAKGSVAMFEGVKEFVEQGHSLRALITHYARQHTGNGLTGSYLEVADYMQEWFETEAADGFILMCPTLPSSLEDFTRLVVPELQRRGLFRAEYEGATLRENLGLSFPVNRHTAVRDAAR